MRLRPILCLLALCGVVSAASAEASCYRCTLEGRMMACNPGFTVGGVGCFVSSASCWTIDVCGPDECARDPLQCIYTRDPFARPGAELSSGGRSLMQKQPGILGVFLRSVVKGAGNAGRIYLGRVVSGMLRDPISGSMYEFSGDLRRIDEGVSIEIDIPNHPQVRRAQVLLTRRGDEMEVRVLDGEGTLSVDTFVAQPDDK